MDTLKIDLSQTAKTDAYRVAQVFYDPGTIILPDKVAGMYNHFWSLDDAASQVNSLNWQRTQEEKYEFRWVIACTDTRGTIVYTLLGL